jgi:Protein of unknown function (DUF3485)
MSDPQNASSPSSRPPSSPPSPPFSVAMKKLMRQPAFVLVAAILLVTAITLNAATQFMQLHFQKKPVPLAQDLKTIPAQLGHWVQVSKDEPLEPDMAHELGATNYVYRDYVDDRKVSASVIDQFKDKTLTERKELLSQVQHQYPDAVLNAGITYYTGMVDTVAHIPDRCYIADGFEPSSYKILSWSAFDGRPGRDEQHDDVRFISFEDQVAARHSEARNVAYFFQANGEYTSDPIGVRLRLQDLRERYGYYAKVELMSISDPETSARIMNDFLTPALPEIEKCLPDWKSIRAKE